MEHRQFRVLGFICVALISITAPGAFAADLDYRYAEARYQRLDLDNGVDGDGIGIGGWYRLNQRFFVAGDAAFLDLDGGTDVTMLGVGVGAIQPLSPNWDGIAMLMLRRTDVDGRVVDRNDNGYAARVGVRGRPGQKLEARAIVNYVDVGGSDTSLSLSGDYYFTPTFSVGLAANVGGDADSISVGGRLYFGKR